MNLNQEYVTKYYDTRDQLSETIKILDLTLNEKNQVAKERTELFYKKKSYIDGQALISIIALAWMGFTVVK